MSRRFGVIGGYETAAALLVIIVASLSVWGAFLIYRAVKGQRRKRGREENTSETEKEAAGRRGEGDEDDWSKSTGKMEETVLVWREIGVETGVVLVPGEMPPCACFTR